MSTIQIDIPDALAQKLAPHQDRLVELLELGLQKWLEHEDRDLATQREKVFRELAAAGKISLPKSSTHKEPYISHTPVHSTGKPASEIINEQRGPV